MTRTTLLLVFLGFLTILPLQAMANTYSVNNIAVDVKSDNSYKARNEAMVEARRDAYNILLSRIVDEQNRDYYAKASDTVIQSLIDNFEINREKASQHRYLANISVHFNPTAVNTYIGRQGFASPYPDSGDFSVTNGTDRYLGNASTTTESLQNKKTLLLPWYGQGNDVTLWRDSNHWKTSWAQYLSTVPNTQNEIILPIGDITDMQTFNPDKPLSFNTDNLNALLQRYGAQTAIIAMADPLPNNLLRVSLYQNTTMTPRFIDRFVIPMNATDPQKSLYPAIYKSVDTIKRISPETTSKIATPSPMNQTNETTPPSFVIDNSSYLPVEAEIKLSSLQQWIGIKQSLNMVEGINNMNIKSLSANRAVITFRFMGSDETLRQALQRRGLNLYNNPQHINGASPYIITG